jgi:hypothetical protein
MFGRAMTPGMAAFHILGSAVNSAYKKLSDVQVAWVLRDIGLSPKKPLCRFVYQLGI